MYDFYPEWGPTRHRDSDESQPLQRRPRSWQDGTPSGGAVLALAGAPEVRDGDGLRPDDN